MKTIAYIAAAILIFFGVLFIWGAFSPDGQAGWIVVGLASVLIGFGLIWFASRKQPATSGESAQNVTLNIDLPGEVKMEKFQCSNCGSNLTKDDIKIVAGTATVNCPYCGQVYQLSEEPKW